ncbi:MAG TPA: glycosyltransferase [Anaerolineales bacterium]|nr:glycosyltransferase [Anaerolineales bacterium]
MHDWLTTFGGGERVLEAALEVTGPAHVFTTAYRPETFAHSIIAQQTIHTSFLNRLPLAQRNHRIYLPLMPFAVEQFDLRPFPLVVSISSAVAHGALTRPDQRHIAYISAPARYAWHLYHDYLEDAGVARGVRSLAARLVLHYLRLWSASAAQRVDCLLAVSCWVAECIRRAYGRKAEVLYPPVDVEKFQPGQEREDFYLVVSRLVPYKKVALTVQAFNRLGRSLVVVGSGPDYRKVAQAAGENISLLGFQPDEKIAELMGRARALIHMAEEDFGISMVEAQAAGCPVIAYGKGGAREIVQEGRTGLLVPEQSADSLIQVVGQFEEQRSCYVESTIRQNALRFSKERFQQQFQRVLEAQLNDMHSD